MKKIISTENAPGPVGAYSQAAMVGGLLFVSGQIPIDPATGELIGGEFTEKARRVLLNIQAIVEAAGGSMDDAVKMNVYLTDLSNFASINEVFGEFFTGEPPARAAVEVSKLPLGADIEIECIASIEPGGGI